MHTFLVPLYVLHREFPEAASPPVFSLGVVSKNVFNILGTLQLSMAPMDWLPKACPIPTHSAVVVTTP